MLDLKKNVVLAPYTNFKVGGPADLFFEAKTKEEILEALEWAKENNTLIYILGDGTNLIVSDKGFRGLILKIGNKGIEFVSDYKARVEAGTLMPDLVSELANKSFKGLAWAGGLPGSFGAAVRGNAGAFGGEMKDSIFEVEAINFQTLEIKKFSNNECNFDYRMSIFKTDNWLVLSAILQLKQGNKEELLNEIEEHKAYRKAKHPIEFPNAGSIFKNCPTDWFKPGVFEQVKSHIKTDPFAVVPTAFLLDQCELKGAIVGGAKISEKHPNFIVNFNNAQAKDILDLIALMKQKVLEKFGVKLQEEVQYLGF